jgi:hypothetical protein
MTLLTITLTHAIVSAVLTLIIAWAISELFRADPVTPMQLDCERLMERIKGCATVEELYEKADDVEDFLDKYKPTASIKAIELMRSLLYTAMRDRSQELRQSSKQKV